MIDLDHHPLANDLNRKVSGAGKDLRQIRLMLRVLMENEHKGHPRRIWKVFQQRGKRLDASCRGAHSDDREHVIALDFRLNCLRCF